MSGETDRDAPGGVRVGRPSIRGAWPRCASSTTTRPIRGRLAHFTPARAAIAIAAVAAAGVAPMLASRAPGAGIAQAQTAAPEAKPAAGPTRTATDAAKQETAPSGAAPATTAPPAGHNATLSGRRIYQRMLHASAWVMARHTGNRTAIGTAWLVDRPGRLLMTNHHVVTPWILGEPPADSVRVYFPESRDGRLITDPREEVREARSYRARIVDLDPRRDLAILQVEDLPPDMEPLTLSGEGCGPGEAVHSLGNPVGGALWIYTSGTVRQVYRKEFNEVGLRIIRCQCVETQEPVNRGDSGGPVVNDQGQLVAVNQSIMVAPQTAVGTLTTFAVDVSEVRAFLDEVRPLLDPSTADDFYRRGLRHLSRGRAALAITDLDEALKRSPSGRDPADILVARAGAESRADRHGDAVRDLTTALKTRPDDPEILVCRGWALLRSNDVSSARDDLEKVIASAQAKTVRGDLLARAYLGRARISFSSNPDDTEYAESLRQAIRSDPRSFRSHVWLAARLDRIGQLKDSLDESNRALAIAQDELDPIKRLEILELAHVAFRDRAHVHARLNRREQALRDYASAIHWRMRVPPYQGQERYLLDVGQELKRLGYASQARLLLDNAKKLSPEQRPDRRTFHERQVYVENKTSSRVVVYFKYHTLGENNRWEWRPGGDLTSREWSAWTVEPGEAALVSVEGKPIQADRIRFVVKTGRNETVSDRYWGEDLVLVSPQGYQGETLDRYVLPLK